ncbi:hypothetical protein SCIM_1291 [Streptococcus intermedius JTH08]|nr:hypothetical protein SCIM_1291 [Streptococcus intermedius JTH08]
MMGKLVLSLDVCLWIRLPFVCLDFILLVRQLFSSEKAGKRLFLQQMWQKNVERLIMKWSVCLVTVYLESIKSELTFKSSRKHSKDLSEGICFSLLL